ncbi:hypothetical protein [Vibrio crassostreae]|uniref:hypothetical protein n=1 Tax=Vibrio crassostreae TaxID=246167 RepID=UPI001B303E85|nr:hypothetical protein [Vibrio crassostreae]
MEKFSSLYDMTGIRTTWTNRYKDGEYPKDTYQCVVEKVLFDHEDKAQLEINEPHNFPMLILKPVEKGAGFTINAYCEEVSEHPFLEIFCHGIRQGIKAIEEEKEPTLKHDGLSFLKANVAKHTPYEDNSQAAHIFKLGFECSAYKF